MDQDHVPTSPNFNHSRNMDPLQVKNYIRGHFSRLMTACVIIRIDDFTVDKVATSAKRRGQKEFITGTYRNISQILAQNFPERYVHIIVVFPLTLRYEI